ncbi:MAG: hypothetical protein ACYC0V_04055 [Armatimonadota bacterium]
MIKMCFALIMIGALSIASSVCALPQKPLLVFEIDEGFPSSLLSAYKDDFKSLDMRLDNIRIGLSELTPKYDVAVLAYPTHLYDRNAFGNDADQPINRIHSALMHVFEYFERYNTRQHKITVMLEAYSSGIATSQNGELASVKPAPLDSNPDSKGISGWAMDVDALAAIKDTFPDVFRGIRFHELYGSDMVWKIRGSHGFLLNTDAVLGAVDLCKRKNLFLLWSDSNWLMKTTPDTGKPLFVYDEQHKPYFQTEPYSGLQDYAEVQLGDKVCFSWANNNYHFTQNLEFLDSVVTASKPGLEHLLSEWFQFSMPFIDFPFKHRKHSKWGMSIQSWFWHEYTNSMNGRYFFLGENDCPVEILQAYVLKGLKEGASVLQFEPSWYLFNEEIGYTNGFIGAYERKPDHSERLVFKRLKQTLMDPDNPDNPPSRLDAIFDKDQQRFHENCASNPPKTFRQSTLGIISSSNTRNAYLDFYSYGRKWIRQDQFRYDNHLFAGDTKDVCRIELQGDGIDEILTVNRIKSGKLIVRFYNQNSGFILEDSEIVSDNAKGHFVGLTTANLIAETVQQGDPDEIIASYEHDGVISFQIYKAIPASDSAFNVRYSLLADKENNEFLNRSLGTVSVKASRFVKLIGMRTDAVMHERFTRSLDKLALVTKENESLRVEIKSDGGSITGLVPNGLIVAIDANLDRRDEICLLNNDEESWQAEIFRMTNTGFVRTETQSLDIDIQVKCIFALKKCILLNGGKRQ